MAGIEDGYKIAIILRHGSLINKGPVLNIKRISLFLGNCFIPPEPAQGSQLPVAPHFKLAGIYCGRHTAR